MNNIFQKKKLKKKTESFLKPSSCQKKYMLYFAQKTNSAIISHATQISTACLHPISPAFPPRGRRKKGKVIETFFKFKFDIPTCS